MKIQQALPVRRGNPGFPLLASLAICLLAGSLAAVALAGGPGRDATLIERENAKPGATDWQLTRVRLDRPRRVPLPLDRGLLLEAERRGGRVPRHHGLHRPAREVRDRGLPHGVLRRAGGEAHDHPGSVPGKGAADAARRAERPARVPVGGDHAPDGAAGLAQRRVPGEADPPASRRGSRALAELRHLHRPRRPTRRHPLPVLRQHLAGVQPLAHPLLALHPPQGRAGSVGGRELRPPLRARGAVPGRRQRPAHGRLRRVPAVRVPALPTSSNSTATT